MKPFLSNICILTVMIFGLSMTSGVSAGSSHLPADDDWVWFCLVNSDPGEDLDECLTWGEVSSTKDPDNRGIGRLVAAKEDPRQSYLSLIARIQGGKTAIDSFKQPTKQFEFVEACGIHFSSGEHPTSIRCHVTNESLGAFDPDIVLSVTWQKLLWNNINDSVEYGNAAVCAVTSDLGQIPADPVIIAQQIVDVFNLSPSCNTAGLSATYQIVPTGAFIDIDFSAQGAGEMPIPGPLSVGTLTY